MKFLITVIFYYKLDVIVLNNLNVEIRNGQQIVYDKY